MTEGQGERQNPGNVFPTQNRCETCGAAFTTGALLDDHILTHEQPEAKQSILERQNERKP
jgi:hypothetical protein